LAIASIASGAFALSGIVLTSVRNELIASVVVALAVLRIAEPEQRRFAVAAVRPAPQHRRQQHRRAVELALADRRQRFVVLALLVRLGEELAVVERDLLRLDLADAVLDALLDVRLLALHLGQVARELLVLAAQLRALGALQLELGVQVDQAALQLVELLAELGDLLGLARALLLVALLEPLAQVEDRLARLVVVEQAGVAAGAASAATRQAPNAGRATEARARASPRRQLGAPVLRPGRLVAALHRRTLLAEADRLDLAVVRAHQGHRLGDRLGALLAEREVVLVAAALVGVALDGDLALAVGGSAFALASTVERYSSFTT
jgi:hypothetical protein